MDEARDRQEITAVLYAYSRLLDLNRLDEVAMLFTEDCVVNYLAGNAGELRGRAGLLGFLRQALATMTATSHHVSNVEIELTGRDSARSIAYLYAWHRMSDGRPDFEVWGQYHDEWRRLADGWRIASRRFQSQGTTADPDPFEPIGRAR